MKIISKVQLNFKLDHFQYTHTIVARRINQTLFKTLEVKTIFYYLL